RRVDPAAPRKMTVEPVVVDGELRYRWRDFLATRSNDEHLAPDETKTRLLHLIGGEFRQAHLHAVDADHQILPRGAAATVRRRSAASGVRRPDALVPAPAPAANGDCCRRAPRCPSSSSSV